jgi:hypothetical protein
VTGRFYVGMHSTSNLEDDYLGSGYRLGYSIKKHGRENHTKEILEFLPDRKSLSLREEEIVNKEFLNDPMCMNLALGGGNWDSGLGGKVSIKKNGKLGNAKILYLEANDPAWKKKRNVQRSETSKKYNLGRHFQEFWKGKKLTEEHKKHISDALKISSQGEKNSQYGSCWVFKDNENKRILKNDLTLYLSQGWTKGRKIGRGY